MPSGISSLRGMISNAVCKVLFASSFLRMSSSENDIADVDGVEVDIKKDEQARNIEIIIEYSFIAESSFL